MVEAHKRIGRSSATAVEVRAPCRRARGNRVTSPCPIEHDYTATPGRRALAVGGEMRDHGRTPSHHGEIKAFSLRTQDGSISHHRSRYTTRRYE